MWKALKHSKKDRLMEIHQKENLHIEGAWIAADEATFGNIQYSMDSFASSNNATFDARDHVNNT